MSIVMRLRTGLSDAEWQVWWKNIQHAIPGTEFLDGSGRPMIAVALDEFRTAVVAEGQNRRFIHRAVENQRISLRAGVLEVLGEVGKVTAKASESVSA